MRRLRESLEKHLPIWLVGGALILGSAYWLQVNKEQERAECQAEYNEAFARTLTIRSEFTTARQNAVDDVIFGVARLIANPPETPAEEKKAGHEYVRLFSNFERVSEENEAARAANPLPTIPNC